MRVDDEMMMCLELMILKIDHNCIQQKMNMYIIHVVHVHVSRISMEDDKCTHVYICLHVHVHVYARMIIIVLYGMEWYHYQSVFNMMGFEYH